MSKLTPKKNKPKKTFTKKWVEILLTIALIDIQLTYILSFFNKEIAETLAITIVTEIIGVSLGYFMKSYFETKEEKKNQLEEERLGLFPEEDNRGD